MADREEHHDVLKGSEIILHSFGCLSASGVECWAYGTFALTFVLASFRACLDIVEQEVGSKGR